MAAVPSRERPVPTRMRRIPVRMRRVPAGERRIPVRCGGRTQWVETRTRWDEALPRLSQRSRSSHERSESCSERSGSSPQRFREPYGTFFRSGGGAGTPRPGGNTHILGSTRRDAPNPQRRTVQRPLTGPPSLRSSKGNTGGTSLRRAGRRSGNTGLKVIKRKGPGTRARPRGRCRRRRYALRRDVPPLPQPESAERAARTSTSFSRRPKSSSKVTTSTPTSCRRNSSNVLRCS
jgi:hypothetical protein